MTKIQICIIHSSTIFDKFHLNSEEMEGNFFLFSKIKRCSILESFSYEVFPVKISRWNLLRTFGEYESLHHLNKSIRLHSGELDNLKLLMGYSPELNFRHLQESPIIFFTFREITFYHVTRSLSSPPSAIKMILWTPPQNLL